MKILLFFLIFTFFTWANQVLCTLELEGKKQALLVGIGDYKGTKHDLPGIKHDLLKMQEFLRAWGFNVVKLYNVNSEELNTCLSQYQDSLSKKDNFVFYYSGHGSSLKDDNNDEEDGQDETLVLSNGELDEHYRDDDLNYMLNKIRAKKIVILDSCHSGTAFKDSSKNLVAKGMMSDWIKKVFYAKEEFIKTISINKLRGSYLVMSAAKDNENSRASRQGSLFTNEIYEMFQKKKLSKSLKHFKNVLSYNISTLCKENEVKTFHPVFSSSAILENSSLRDFLK